MTKWIEAAKRDALISALNDLPSVYVHVRVGPGVRLPEPWMKHPRVVLQLGYKLAVPMREFRIDDTGFTATLTFNRVPYDVVVPWESVFGIIDAVDPGVGVVFEDTVAAPKQEPPKQEPPKPSRPPHLRIVK